MPPEDPLARLSEAIAELAADDVSELIAAAQTEARARVRSMLVTAMAKAMLERVHEQLRQRPSAERPSAERPSKAVPRQPAVAPELHDHPAAAPAEPSPPTAPREGPLEDQPRRAPRKTPDFGHYVYCIVHASSGPPPAITGIDPAHPLTTVRQGNLAAVTSRVSLEDFGEDHLRQRLSDMDWLGRTARVHEHVLDTLGENETLIPMRLCSVYRTEDGVREMLEREAGALEAALEHLQGKTEWGVKVFADLESTQEHVAQDTGELEEPGAATGTEYMQRRQSARQQRQLAERLLDEACEQIHERLSATSADQLTSPPQRPEVSGHPGQMILNGIYLVEDHERAAFHEEIQALQQEFARLGLELEPTGPWPAYNFVPGTIGAAW